MFSTIATSITVSLMVCGAIGTILTAFFKTNKDATKEHKEIEDNFNVKIEKIEQSIENVKNHYVSNENFKTYADSITNLLKLSSDRMVRIEDMLDDIRSDLNSMICSLLNRDSKK